MPVRRFAGQVLRFIPFAGDIYNTFNEYRDQVQAGIAPIRAAARAIPVGVTGMVTNVVDPVGVSNIAPEALRYLAAQRAKAASEGKAQKVFSEPVTDVTRGLDPRVTSGMLPYMVMGQMLEDPKELQQAAKMADYINSEAYARSIVDRVDPQTQGKNFSMDVNERYRQLVDYLKR